jgi:hypothetical protein
MVGCAFAVAASVRVAATPPPPISVFRWNDVDRNVRKRTSLACYKSVIPVKYHIKSIPCLLDLYGLELISLPHQIDKTFYFLLLQV